MGESADSWVFWAGSVCVCVCVHGVCTRVVCMHVGEPCCLQRLCDCMPWHLQGCLAHIIPAPWLPACLPSGLVWSWFWKAGIRAPELCFRPAELKWALSAFSGTLWVLAWCRWWVWDRVPGVVTHSPPEAVAHCPVPHMPSGLRRHAEPQLAARLPGGFLSLCPALGRLRETEHRTGPSLASCWCSAKCCGWAGWQGLLVTGSPGAPHLASLVGLPPEHREESRFGKCSGFSQDLLYS